jgi:hypothetical protein
VVLPAWLLYQRVLCCKEAWRAQPLAVLSMAASSNQAGKRELLNSFTAKYFLSKVLYFN